MRSLPCIFLLAIFCATTACGDRVDSRRARDSAARADSIALADSIDTAFVYDGYRVLVQIRKRGQLVASTHFVPDNDTTYYKDGSWFVEQSFLGLDQVNYTHYDSAGKMVSRHVQYERDGMGGTKGEITFYNKQTGAIDSVLFNSDYLPDGATSHLDICGVITRKVYYPNGKLKLSEQTDDHYEGGYYCPCGTWEYYDSLGNLTKKEQYKKCGDGKTDCYSSW